MGRYPGRIRDIIECYRVKDCPINVKLFRVVLNLCRQARIADEGLWILRKMDDFWCRPDLTMYNVVIGLFYEKGDLDSPMELMREMESSELCPNMITFMSMLKVFCYVGRLEDACQLFKTMKRYGCAQNMLAYTVLFDGLCRVGSFEKVLELLGEMEKEGGECTPNVITYMSVILNSCENDLEKKGFVVNDISALLVGLCQQNRVVEVAKLASLMAEKGFQINASYIDDIHKHVKGSIQMDSLAQLFKMRT